MSREGKSPQNRRTVPWAEGGLLLLGVALGGVLWWEWQSGMSLESSISRWRKVPVTAVPPLAIAPEFRLPDAAHGFPELLARPIFQSSRRMAVDPSASAPSAMKRGQFVLVGTLLSPTTSAALLRDVQTGKTETVVRGGQIGGMTLAEVSAEAAVLRLGVETEVLPLALQRGSGGKVAPGGAAKAVTAATTGTAPAATAPVPAPAVSSPAIEGVIPPTVPVPPTPAQPYSSGPRVGPGALLGVGAGAGAGGNAGRPGSPTGAPSGGAR